MWSVVAEEGRNADKLPHLLRMADGDLHRDAATHAVTEQIGLLDFEALEHRGNTKGSLLPLPWIS